MSHEVGFLIPIDVPHSIASMVRIASRFLKPECSKPHKSHKQRKRTHVHVDTKLPNRPPSPKNIYFLCRRLRRQSFGQWKLMVVGAREKEVYVDAAVMAASSRTSTIYERVAELILTLQHSPPPPSPVPHVVGILAAVHFTVPPLLLPLTVKNQDLPRLGKNSEDLYQGLLGDCRLPQDKSIFPHSIGVYWRSSVVQRNVASRCPTTQSPQGDAL